MWPATVRDVIHAFNEIGLRALDPQWAGGRPRLINDDDIAFIVATAKARPFPNWLRQRIGLEHHNARVPAGLWTRTLQRLLALNTVI